ncbi:sigma-54-dependent transcriptional regulator [Hoeflea olei]|uniref:DNA-binding transcriptional regulator NtrC n=1 Tax=Hoeflea olei TaxID=1480615 RepID=A0A1C1Z0R9_9HYPH|nr:sigma-54 dependent transcriptional regulator [Hoeflea olei]OCW59358.1 Fis family transcriptional regulator [Hoeflea olei]
MSNRILIVDDDPVQRRLLKAAAERAGYVTEMFQEGRSALARLCDAPDTVDAVVLDLMMPEMDGLELLAQMRERGMTIPVVVQTGQGGIETVVKAMRAGAFDFVVKPVSPERLALSLSNALKTSQSGAAPKLARKGAGFKDIVAASPAMERVLSLGYRAAASTIPVVLEGESGVGKEMIAQAIQAESSRRGKPFVTVNCGAIPENLVESILFGHEKGAFTGAADRHPGKFCEADGGTLFLDEIGDLAPEIQVKLLRAVQFGEIETVGARVAKKVDVRLISATNKDLIAEVKAGRFREDLYYRLNVFPIHVPALRKRKEDIPQLVRHFTQHFAEALGKPRIRTIAPDAMALLTAHDWPGNIRELENAVHRAIVLCDGDTVTSALFPQIAAQMPGYSLDSRNETDGATSLPDLPPAAPGLMASEPAVELDVSSLREDPAPPAGHSLPAVNAVTRDGEVRPLSEVEEELIRFALSFYRGQMSEVARRLGIGRSTLYRKLKDYSIDPDNPRREAA